MNFTQFLPYPKLSRHFATTFLCIVPYTMRQEIFVPTPLTARCALKRVHEFSQKPRGYEIIVWFYRKSVEILGNSCWIMFSYVRHLVFCIFWSCLAAQSFCTRSVGGIFVNTKKGRALSLRGLRRLRRQSRASPGRASFGWVMFSRAVGHVINIGIDRGGGRFSRTFSVLLSCADICRVACCNY